MEYVVASNLARHSNENNVLFVKGKTLKWISSFLGGRTQAVVLEGECSSKVPDTSDVPQGYVLGPHLAVHK